MKLILFSLFALSLCAQNRTSSVEIPNAGTFGGKYDSATKTVTLTFTSVTRENGVRIAVYFLAPKDQNVRIRLNGPNGELFNVEPKKQVVIAKSDVSTLKPFPDRFSYQLEVTLRGKTYPSRVLRLVTFE